MQGDPMAEQIRDALREPGLAERRAAVWARVKPHVPMKCSLETRTQAVSLRDTRVHSGRYLAASAGDLLVVYDTARCRFSYVDLPEHGR
ncbi:hypothetical protein SAMN05421543_11878 [Alicyclobacillus macrosporangiidus]|uniref:Uncharacterized protein n=2 Tax=Alicyclobacillus macrosporangiidus TaxID=392015 RepID=A0A1I7KS05_9BACL|nr:hypothetical protein SAMN05421543_11878 [Alicyclobacillus macrosporangiidus]